MSPTALKLYNLVLVTVMRYRDTGKEVKPKLMGIILALITLKHKDTLFTNA
jgi:hypothetical protein